MDDGSRILGAWATPELEQALTWEPARIVAPAAWAGHIPFAFWLVRSLHPASLVELGTHSGNSYFAFCQAMAALTPTGRAYAVDSWVGDEHAGFYGEDIFAAVHGFNEQHFRPFSTLMRMTFDEARAYFPDGGIDLLHIDGMHTYEAVRHDFETWQAALSDRAVVVFHDINVRERGFGVWRFWEEVRERYPSFAFHHSHGLGVLGVGREQAPALQALFGLGNGPSAGFLRACLAARGEAFQRQVEVLDLRGMEAKAAGLEAELEHRGTVAADSIAWRDSLIGTQREIIASKDAAMVTLENTSAARAQSLVVRDGLLATRDAMAAQLMEDVRQQRFLTREERRVRDEMQAGYEQAIAGLNRHREELQAQIDHARHETREAELAVARRYVSTTSWKLTRPLRVATRLLRGRGAAPDALAPPPPPAPALPAPEPAALPAADPAPAADVTSPTPVKHAFRTLLSARLRTFLSGPAMLALPRAEQPDVSVLLILYNQAELTFACLESIVATLSGAPFGVEVIVADNGSTDETLALLDRIEGATVIRNGANLHYLKATNLAAQSARGRALLLLNNDAQLLPGSLEQALRTLDSAPDIGAVGGRIILPDGTLQEAGSIIWRDGACTGFARGQSPTAPEAMFQRDVDYCSGAFLLTPTALFREMGGFDERYAPAYYEETDYCVRLWKDGRRVVYDPDAAIIHYEFGSSTASGTALRLQAANHAVFAAQHRDWLAGQFPASPLNLLHAARADRGRLRVLMLEDRVPHVQLGSGYPRSNRLVQELVDAGADVTFYPMTRFKQGWQDVRQSLDKRVEVLISAEKGELHDYLVARPHQFDVILVCRPHNMKALLDAIGPERHLLGGATVLYDAEALFVTRDLQQMAARGQPATALERHAMVAEEVSLTRIADAVLSVSLAEQSTLQQYGVREVHLLGHALDDTPLPAGFEERDQIVFIGAIGADDLPNADAVRWFAGEILPPLRRTLGMPDLRLTVIGMNKAQTITALDGDRVDLLGMVDELPPALARARVMVVPTRFAAGIPHKAHQAAMLGIPMVTTRLIAEQLGWTGGVELLAEDEPVAFAEACARLYADRALWERTRQAALERVQRDCSAPAFTAMVRAILKDVPIVHRRPEPEPDAPPRAEKPKPPAPAAEPHTSRPPETDWAVAVPFSYVPAENSPRLAVIAHLFHPQVGAELLYYLRRLPIDADLYLSTDTPEKEAELRATFGGWDKGGLTLRVVPNRGRDIAPKLVGFADVHAQYDLVLHLHSKMSNHASFLAPWRSYLFETLMGSPEVVRSILDAFARLPDLGMVAPQHFEAVRRWLGWNGNLAAATALAKRMDLHLLPGRALDFPSGSMFWARPAALRPLLDLKLAFEDFPDEGAQLDHTPAHAIERLFFYACERSGHSWLKVAQPALMFDTKAVVEITSPAGLSRFMAEHGVALTGPQPVPVLDAPVRLVAQVAPGLAARLAARTL